MTSAMFSHGSTVAPILPETGSSPSTKLILPIRGQKQAVMLDKIVCLEGDGNFTNVCLRDGSKVLVARTLKDYEQMLDQQQFVRIHKSCIVNLNFVGRVNDEGELELTTGRLVKVARRRLPAFTERLAA